MELKTLQYFSHNLTDPIHEVFQVLDNPNHSEYNKLLHDMKSINAEELSLFVIEKQIDFYIKDSFNIDIERRAWFLINRLHRDIASKRLDELSGNGVRLKPYNSLNLKAVSYTHLNSDLTKIHNIYLPQMLQTVLWDSNLSGLNLHNLYV